MGKGEIYLFGQVLGSHSFWLEHGFLKPDEYSEIREKYFLPGGETGTCATVLASLGAQIRLDGTHIGYNVAPMLKGFYQDKSVDLSSMFFDEKYPGLEDFIVIADSVRSPMGEFQHLYASGVKRWNAPTEADIEQCEVAAIDPYFQEETQLAAELCVKHQKPYVTIDCKHDTYLHQHAAINIISSEGIHDYYEGMDKEDIFRLLQENSSGLTIITSGSKEMLYGRKGEPMKKAHPFKVDVKSTLGAGDTFKAGCVYGLWKGFDDEKLIRFASACSGVAISRFPLPLNPPTMEEVEALCSQGQ